MPDDAVEIDDITDTATTYADVDWDVVHQGGVTKKITAANKAAGTAFASRYGPVTSQHVFVPATSFVASFGTPVVGLVSGSAGAQGIGFLMDGGAVEQGVAVWGVPDFWVTMDIDVHWVNAGAGSGNVAFIVSGGALAPGASMGGADTFYGALTPTALAQDLKKVSTVVAAAGLTAARQGHLRITRLGNEDTLANDVAIVGVNLRRLT